jgi:hypothetical protein
MSHGVKTEVLLEIRMPVGMKALAVVGEAICKAYPLSVMRQQGDHLLFEVPIEKNGLGDKRYDDWI